MATPQTRQELERAAGDALRQSEKRRAAARARRAELRQEAERQLTRFAASRRPWWQKLFGIPAAVSPRMIELTTNVWAGNDPHWKTAASDERWYGQQSVEYATNAALKPSAALVDRRQHTATYVTSRGQ